MLSGELLRLGYKVTVVDDLLFGGESLLAYLPNENFRFVKSNVWEPRAIRKAVDEQWPMPGAVVHLAAIVGFPACQAVGRQVAWRYNVEATQRVFEQSEQMGVERFVFLSTYSNYGLSQDDLPVTEESPLTPQSLYAETKIASERYLLAHKDSTCAPLIFRLATLYGISPRTRFDLIINQFVLEAYLKRELMIYQRGYSRSFLHIQDAVRGIILGLRAADEKIRAEVYNLGSQAGNFTKDEIVAFVLQRLPETMVRYKDMTFGGDMRDIRVSFEKIHQYLGFEALLTPEDGVREVLHAIRNGLISDPQNPRYRNAQFIVQ
jgi:nucleoside-diphosphate-sugar epimerase